MEKLVYVLWKPPAIDTEDWCAELRGPVSDAVVAAGARGLQVNVADAAVADAIVRLSTFDQPIGAVVSVWLDSATGPPGIAVLEALEGVAARLAGYLVTESVRLQPPPSDLGARTDGFANVALLRRPDGLDRCEWLHRWQGLHTAVALDTQGTVGYVQNVVVRSVTAGAPTIHGIVEEVFPTEALTDLHVFFATGGDDDELARRLDVMTASVAHFSGEHAPLDVIASSRFVLRAPFAT